MDRRGRGAAGTPRLAGATEIDGTLYLIDGDDPAVAVWSSTDAINRRLGRRWSSTDGATWRRGHRTVISC